MAKKNKNMFTAAGKRPGQKLNITSLMDVLTIILIFLLVNYSSVVEEINLPESITLPKIPIKTVGDAVEGITLIIDKDRWIIDDRQFLFNSFTTQQNEIMEKSSEALTQIKKLNEANGKRTNVILFADKDIPYKMIDSAVLMTAGAGITSIDFIAMRQEL